MHGILAQFGPGTAFTLVLLALLGLRASVTPRTSLWIKTTPEKLWALLETSDGKTENWGRTNVVSKLIDASQQIYEKTYTTILASGVARTASALFKVSARQENQKIELRRFGLDEKSLNNELLEMRHELTPENGGVRLRTTYQWGSRPLIAQLIARADLWSGAYRIKGLAETGIPNERPYHIISAAVALVTGLISLVGFAVVLRIDFAIALVLALFVHEFGHLLAFRLVGQPWGRMVFLPFLGAMAMPRMSFETQGQAVFSALMGPGLSTLLTIGCAAHLFLGYAPIAMLCILGAISAFLNLFNLVPAEPLDGGIALRSVLTRLIGKNAYYGLMAIGALVVGAGLYWEQMILMLFGGLAILANIRPRKIDAGLAPLSTLEMCITAFSYAAICFTHLTLLRYFIEKLNTLSS